MQILPLKRRLKAGMMIAVHEKSQQEEKIVTKEEIEEAIEALGKGASVRGEALSLEEFAKLSNLLGK